MGVAAAATAGSAYVLGQVINQAYVDKNVAGIAIFSGIVVVLLFIKGIATYGHTVILAKIGNAILANNQRRLFAKLMNENIGVLFRTPFVRIPGAPDHRRQSDHRVLDLLVNAVGRDLLLLIALVGVMVVQDPMLSLFGLVVVPPAMLLLRKLVKRIKGLAHNQVHRQRRHPGDDAGIAAGHPHREGVHAGRRRCSGSIDEHIAASSSNANKMARVSNRANPLMEMLGGFAVAGCLLYGGYSVVALGATPGQFFSFMTAFLLATEPAKRLARLNIDLNSKLVGARMLLEIVDSPASEPDDDDKPALKLSDARIEFRDVSFAYRTNEPVLQRA